MGGVLGPAAGQGGGGGAVGGAGRRGGSGWDRRGGAAGMLRPVRGGRIGGPAGPPILRTGFSECSAPWKKIEAPAQRTARRRPQFILSTSSPLNRICPVTLADDGSSRRIEMAIVDLPQPDSPARPRVWPGSRLRFTPRTAGTGPPSVA